MENGGKPMAKKDLFLAVLDELERLKKVPFAELVGAIENGEGFYDEYLFSIPPAET